MQRQVELRGDLLIIAADELDTSAELLLQKTRLTDLEENGDLGPVAAAAMSGAWVIRRQPFPKLNLEIGYRFMRLLLKEAKALWPRPEEDRDRIVRMLQMLETGLISEARFAEWVCLRVTAAERLTA